MLKRKNLLKMHLIHICLAIISMFISVCLSRRCFLSFHFVAFLIVLFAVSLSTMFLYVDSQSICKSTMFCLFETLSLFSQCEDDIIVKELDYEWIIV